MILGEPSILWQRGAVCRQVIRFVHEREAVFDPLEGWYENDRAAAVSYTLANVEDPAMDGAIGAVVRGLYLDSKEEAGKFIESLPEDKRADAIERAFHNLILGDEENTGEAVLTPRAVASWMTQFPPACWKDTLGRLFARSSSGPEDMVSWIEQQPPSLREAVAAEYTAFFEKSPSETILPVLRVADSLLRDQLLRATVVNGSLELDEARTAIRQCAALGRTEAAFPGNCSGSESQKGPGGSSPDGTRAR